MIKSARILLCLVVALWVIPMPHAQADNSFPPAAPIDPAVWNGLPEGGTTEVLLILRQQADLSAATTLPTKQARGRYVVQALRAVAERSQRDLRASLDAQGVDYQGFYLVNAIKVQLNKNQISALAFHLDIDRIVANPRVESIQPVPAQPSSQPAPQEVGDNIKRVKADQVWAQGFSGQGVVIAGQDTGYDWDHPALKDAYRGWNSGSADHDYHWHDAIHSGGGICGADAPAPCDDHGHGTHTMGTLVGDDGAGNQIGMAPGAQWIGCRNMDQGVGTPATYIECFEFFLAPYPVGASPTEGDPDLAPHVISNSWACPPYEGCDAASLEAAVEAVRQAGIVVVASAGNYGSACGSVLYPPAIYQQTFTVGGFNHRDDTVYGLSSRGPVTYGNQTYTKPDISAPGVSVYSCIPGTGYGYKSGTSMAAPHVGGAVALLLSAVPAYAGNVDGIEGILKASATPRTSSQSCGGDGSTTVPNNVWGWGMLDAHAAVTLAQTSGALWGTVTSSSDALPISDAELTVEALSFPALQASANTDASGNYTLTLPADTYTLTVAAPDHMPQTLTDTTVISGGLTMQNIVLHPARYLYLPLCIR